MVFIARGRVARLVDGQRKGFFLTTIIGEAYGKLTVPNAQRFPCQLDMGAAEDEMGTPGQGMVTGRQV